MNIQSFDDNALKEIMSELSPDEKDEVLKILNEYSSDGQSKLLEELYNEDFDEIPVDIDTFIESNNYIGEFTGNGTLIYPYWREQLRRMFSNDDYQEVALTGSIGVGKSTIACVAMAYLLYKTMCLKDPQKYYRLAAGSTIVFAFFNNTLDLTTSVGYGTIQNICQKSPWFLERGSVSGTKYKEYIPDKLIRFKIGSQASHALGMNVISGLIDEVNFKQGANVRMEQSKIMETYNGVLERMGSRFMMNGKLAGKLFIVSSKKSEYDFLESYIKKKKDDPSVLVCDAKLWEVKPTGTYSGKTFSVAVGGSNMPSRIIPDGEDIDIYIKQGYEIINPPIEFKGRFEMDIQAALMNIAGISISHVTKFITYENLAKCYCKSRNPFSTNILTIGTRDNLAIKDFFDPKAIRSELYTRPIFIHEDMSLTGDRTGISAVAAMGYKYQNQYDIESGEMIPIKAMVFKHIFSIGIQCPSGAEISFQKSRDFICYLRYLGWNIKATSADSFQSADNKQQMITLGFRDSSIISLDRKPDGYLALRSAINEQRISMLYIPELEIELIRLERDNMTGKIDHTPDGSKDISDSLAGALYNAILHSDELNFSAMEDLTDISDVNSESRTLSDKEVLLSRLSNNSDKPMTLKDALNDYLSKRSNNVIEDNTNDEIRKAKDYIQDAQDLDDGIFII